jgi:hypothetical protein
MLEKTAGATNNGQSRDTGKNGHTTQNEDKQNRNHKNKIEKNRMNLGALEWLVVPVPYKTHTVLLA